MPDLLLLKNTFGSLKPHLLESKKGQRRSPVEGEGNCWALFYEKNYLVSEVISCSCFDDIILSDIYEYSMANL